MAATLVSKTDSIFISSGSTCYLFAEQLKEHKDLTVITNNASIIPILAPVVRNFLFLGGSIVCESNMYHSSFTLETVQTNNIYVNKVFTGVFGIDKDAGFTLNDQTTSVILKHVFNMSRSLIVLADSSKYNKIGIFQLAPIDKVSCVVSDAKISNDYKELFFDNNIQSLIAFDL